MGRYPVKHFENEFTFLLNLGMIEVNEIRIGNYCHAKQKSKKFDSGNDSDKISALEKLRTVYRDFKGEKLYEIVSISGNGEVEVL